MPILQDKKRRSELRGDLDLRLAGAGESIAIVIKDLRKILAKDQSEFAAYTGISLATLRKIEQERGNVTVGSINKILQKFRLGLVVKSK